MQRPMLFRPGFTPALLTLFLTQFATTMTAEPIQPELTDKLMRELPAHPRLLARAERWEELRGQVKSDELSARLFALVKEKADRILSEPPLVREMTGRRLLDVSRRCLDRVVSLATVYRIEGDPKYAARARDEMLAAADFIDWNPSHFLDVAEMTCALAIGYDWLHDALEPAERERIAGAIVEEGLKSSLAGGQWWITRGNNWNPVCHAGMTLGALAVAERQPELARQLIERAVASVPKVAGAYAPDGNYDEGPTYWDYGTSFLVLLVAALESSLGSDFGLASMPGLAPSAEFMRQVVGPSGDYFDYSDSGPRPGALPAMFWFAIRAGDSRLLQDERAKLSSDRYAHRLLALALVWHRPLPDAKRGPLPLAWKGDGPNPVAFFRTAWNDPEAVYLAMKGGSPSVSHAHMDAGQFILEVDGVRWAVELGMQDYHSLEKAGLALFNMRQESQRWEVFRVGSEGHNILRFDGAPQRVGGKAPITRFRGEAPAPHAVVDLTSIYSDQAQRVERGVALLPDRRVLVRDRWTARGEPLAVTWQMLTRAAAQVSGDTIQLEQDGKRLELRVLAPTGATLKVEDVSQPARPYDAPNPGLSRIVIGTRTDAEGAGEFRILLTPGSAKAAGGRAPEFPEP